MHKKPLGITIKKGLAALALLMFVALVFPACAAPAPASTTLSAPQQQPAADVEAPPAPAVPAPPVPEPAAPASVSLDVPLIYQNPELINGCEATSLCILLRYHGFDADKGALAYDYIPREDFWVSDSVRYGPRPETAYPGDPATTTGFYCFSGPIVAGANSYLAEQESALQAYDLSGASAQALEQELADGHPVMVWLTLDYGARLTYCSFVWQLPDGTTYLPYCNLHCVVLAGFDENGYQVCDPINGSIYVSRDDLLGSYQVMGSIAVVIK